MSVGAGWRSAVLAAAMAILVTQASPASAGEELVWGTIDSPNRGNRQNALSGVAALSSNDVWVVEANGTQGLRRRRPAG